MEGLMEGRTPRWTDIVAMAQQAEAVGFDSIWVNDHFFLHLGSWPPSQSPATVEAEARQVGMWECTSMLSALAASTSRVELGTLVIGAGFRNPALLAKMADTIDEISGGRLILGVGAGYHEPEYRAFGYPTDHRYSRFEEAIQIIHGLLRNGRIDFAGTYYSARECELRPRGPRPGGPPIMIGGRGPKMLRLAARYADLWNMSLPAQWRSRLEYVELVDAACREVGRAPSTLGRTGWMLWRPANEPEAMPPWVSKLMEPLSGTPEDVATVFRDIALAGISHVQVAVLPVSLRGIEAFRPVLEALDEGYVANR
jgi:probable F420-dependent oxidoreductase